MARNKRYERGVKIKYPVPSGTESGDPVLIGQMPGVALTDRGTDNEATVDFEGYFDLEVTATAADIAVGDILYAHGTGPFTIDNVAAAGVRFGYAGEALAEDDTDTILVRLGY